MVCLVLLGFGRREGLRVLFLPENVFACFLLLSKIILFFLNKKLILSKKNQRKRINLNIWFHLVLTIIRSTLKRSAQSESRFSFYGGFLAFLSDFFEKVLKMEGKNL